MNSKYKKSGVIIAVVGAVIMILTFITNIIIERKIKNAIDDLPKTVDVTYASIEASVWSGNLTLFSPYVIVNGETTDKVILETESYTIEVNSLSYWDFLFNDKISMESIVVNDLISKYKHNPLVKKDDYNRSFLDKIKKAIQVDKIEIKDADVLISNYDTDSLLLSIPKFNFKLLDFKINPNESKTNKNITFKDFECNAQHIKWATNEFENITIDSAHATHHNANFKGFELKTKYTKADYSKILEKERDHFNLAVKEIQILDMDFGYNDEDVFYFMSEKIDLNTPDAEIYRDKLVADDFSYKPLYGTSLRDLDFNLGLKRVEIIDGKISYLEKVKSDEEAGRLDFAAMQASFTNIGNTFGNDDTVIQIQSTFMENSSLNVDWNFKVADTTDQFIFKADLGLFDATQMNQFTQPNLYVGLDGELKQTYFTISGNPIASRIDMKMKYDEFEISVLKSNGKEKNKFLSSLANLFVSKDSEDDKKKYRYGQAEEVERVTNKSVFNFIWLSIKAALLSAMTGDGNK
ncbi:hypothetical protein [Winogradskyella sp. SM1960]|uniref:hypothetical protein n=1 Tax=Winogradskyella sp. SM1960 TaxID=2865955 RepID=UPI001CD80AF0|nr:hypothetical protein [Winogradskyella sp. SM1960]